MPNKYACHVREQKTLNSTYTWAPIYAPTDLSWFSLETTRFLATHLLPDNPKQYINPHGSMKISLVISQICFLFFLFFFVGLSYLNIELVISDTRVSIWERPKNFQKKETHIYVYVHTKAGTLNEKNIFSNLSEYAVDITLFKSTNYFN